LGPDSANYCGWRANVQVDQMVSPSISELFNADLVWILPRLLSMLTI